MTKPDRRLRVQWVLDELTREENGQWSSTYASSRYRGLIPAEALNRLGQHVEVVPMGEWVHGATDSQAAPDVVVVGKLITDRDAEQHERRSDLVLQRVRKERLRGAYVVADVCDDHFQNPTVGEHWRNIVRLADACVVSSKMLALRVASHTNAPVHFVDDAVGSPRGQPTVFRIKTPTLRQRVGIEKTPPLRLCWYGRKTNWWAMKKWIIALAQDMPATRLLLRVVTAPYEPIQEFVSLWNVRNESTFKIEFIPWDQATQWEVVQDSDVVLVPSDPAEPQLAAKSSNRVADALHAGRFVVASPIDAYQAYAEYICLTDEPAQALRSYLADPDASLARLLQGQAVVAERSGPIAIADQWMQALDPGTSEPTAATDTTVELVSAAPVRLNLGCGDKILPGYVNVDVVASRRGRAPDVLCDLHDLSVFPDNHADEVMAIHVVEHFWRWEIEDVLREWLRVLKPGGRMVLECPNLISACEEFLRDPELAADQGQAGQRTMWVFYGDPAWKDPYMIHRWGYTPGSLKTLLESVGLVEVRQEAAQYKLREPRDMRVVGLKPR